MISPSRVSTLRICAAAAGCLLALSAPDRAAAADLLDDSFLRGTFAPPTVRWDGINIGAHLGVMNMNTDFSHATSPIIGQILTDSTLQDEAAPSEWVALPNSGSNGRSYGAFLGYNVQWDQVVLGFDLAYNKTSGVETSSTGSIERVVATSDDTAHDVTIVASSSLKLIDYATMRFRAGYAFGQFMPYAVIGGAVGRFNYANTATVTDVQTASGGGPPVTFGPVTDTDAKNNAFVGGFVAGLGLDVAITPSMFLRAEWEFVGFAKVGGISTGINTGRVGLGVKF
jgi:opacity protein-like surface antigen